MNLFNVEARVSRGATLLDLYRPSWFERVDETRLDIFSSENCILAQVYGSFGTGYLALWDYLGHSLDLDDYGFASVCDRMTFRGAILSLLEHRQLKRAWSREIDKRRSEAAICQRIDLMLGELEAKAETSFRHNAGDRFGAYMCELRTKS